VPALEFVIKPKVCNCRNVFVERVETSYKIWEPLIQVKSKSKGTGILVL